jgi:hypothetical protein
MVSAMRHGVLFSEAMGLLSLLPDLRYGVLICDATRRRRKLESLTSGADFLKFAGR